jgi:DNA invertase Pin-like site-specific DNA recombinase
MKYSVNQPTAFSYVRMSTEQQTQGDSLRRQLDLSRSYALKNGLILDESLRDIGVSAWSGANIRTGALGRFFEMVLAGQILRGSYLLVESFDRLSRQEVRKSIGPFIDLINAGIIVVTLGDMQIYSEASVDDNFAQLILSLAIMSRAHEESQTKSKRIKEAHENRRRNAATGQGRFSQQIWGWLDQIKVGPNDFTYRLNRNADAIKRIYELADQGLGQLQIARCLNHSGTPGLRAWSPGWRQAMISNILRNEAVIGTYQPVRTTNGRREKYCDPIPGYLPAVIDEELFWRVQRNKRQRLSKTKQGSRMANIIGPISACQWGQSSMRIQLSGLDGKSQRYYRCDGKFRGVPCMGGRKHFRYDIVEAAVLDNLSRFRPDPALSIEATATACADINAVILDLTTSLGDLEKRRGGLIALAEIAESAEDRKLIGEKLNSRRVEVEATRARLDELRCELRTIKNKRNNLRELLDKIQRERQTWDSDSDFEVRKSRSLVSMALADFIQSISFDAKEREFTIHTFGGLRAFVFNHGGALIRSS